MISRFHRFTVIPLLIAAVFGHSTPTFAVDLSQADKDKARALLTEGRKMLDGGNAEGALTDFQEAHKIMGVPTTGLYLAKAQVAVGQLIEAQETALEVTRMPVAPGEPEAFAEARAAAVELAGQLAGRIPTLVIHLHGPSAGSAVSVHLDNAAILPGEIEQMRKLNPGQHTVDAMASGFVTKQRTVVLRENDAMSVDLTLPPVDPPAPPPAPVKAQTAHVAEGALRGTPTWVWGVGAAGLAVLGVSVGFAIDYASVRSTVTSTCPGNVCDPKQVDQAGMDSLRSRWNRDLGLMVGMGAVGLIGVGTGVYGLATAKPAKPSDASGVTRPRTVMLPWLSPTAVGAGIKGVF